MPFPQPSSPASHDPRMAKIVRRHVHDMRNHVNCLDLEAMLMEDVITDPEAVEAVHRMRAQLRQVEATLKSFSFKFSEPQPTTLTAADLFRLWMLQLGPLEDDAHSLEAQEPTDLRVVEVDPNAILSVLRELVVAAWNRSPKARLKIAVKTTESEVIAELREPVPRTAAAEDMVRENEHLVALNGGTLEYVIHAERGEAVTTLTFPVTPD